MGKDRELIALIDLIYDAALDSDLWPVVLIKLADAVGAAQIAMPSLDWRSNNFATIAPRTDPDLLASYKEYWAFNEPVLPRAVLRPVGEIYTLDSLTPREELRSTPVFNEWWRPAGYGVAAMGANLVAENRFSASLCIVNAPGKDSLAAEQKHVFEVVLQHIGRAVNINRRLWDLELKYATTSERFETLPQGALLADASARVVRANIVAKAMLDAGGGIFLDNGRRADLFVPRF